METSLLTALAPTGYDHHQTHKPWSLCSLLAHTTVRNATLTTHWCAARLGYWRRFITTCKQGIQALLPPRCSTQRKLWSLLSPLKMPCLRTAGITLPLWNGTTPGRPFRKQPLQPLGGRPASTATGLKLSQMRWLLLLKQSMLLLLNTSAHQVKSPPGTKSC